MAEAFSTYPPQASVAPEAHQSGPAQQTDLGQLLDGYHRTHQTKKKGCRNAAPFQQLRKKATVFRLSLPNLNLRADQ